MRKVQVKNRGENSQVGKAGLGKIGNIPLGRETFFFWPCVWMEFQISSFESFQVVSPQCVECCLKKKKMCCPSGEYE